MNRCLQGFAAALVAVALIFAHAGPAMASGQELEDRGSVNVVFDAVILRPIGLMMTALGGMIFVFPVAPIVALTRPEDLRLPLEALVMRPARYTFVDPLGHH